MTRHERFTALLREQLEEESAVARAAFDDDRRGPAWAFGYLESAVRDFLNGTIRHGRPHKPCPECEAIGEHEPGCHESPNWEPSDDDLNLNGEGVAASREAERRALEDAGR